MTSLGHTARKRVAVLGLLTLPLAVGGWVWAGAAQGAGTQPSMEVLPKSTGLQYSQSVEIKGHNLPKGSGTVAATICGLQDTAGKTIPSPTADDCAGQAEIGKLVVVKSWQSNGEFDTQYTLPASGETFGKNARFCNRSHHCALVVADANPSNPAYHVEKVIQFVDEDPFGASATTTTKPKTTTTKPKTTTTQPGSSTTAPTTATTQPDASQTTSDTTPPPSTSPTTDASTGAAPAPANGSSGGVSGSVTVNLPPVTIPAAPANPVPAPVAQGLDQVCNQIASAVKQAGGDPSALLTACSAIESGTGPQQLAQVLQAPTLLCVLGASAWQNNQQVTDACIQAATALTPVTAQLGGLLGSLPGLP